MGSAAALWSHCLLLVSALTVVAAAPVVQQDHLPSEKSPQRSPQLNVLPAQLKVGAERWGLLPDADSLTDFVKTVNEAEKDLVDKYQTKLNRLKQALALSPEEKTRLSPRSELHGVQGEQLRNLGQGEKVWQKSKNSTLVMPAQDSRHSKFTSASAAGSKTMPQPAHTPDTARAGATQGSELSAKSAMTAQTASHSQLAHLPVSAQHVQKAAKSENVIQIPSHTDRVQNAEQMSVNVQQGSVQPNLQLLPNSKPIQMPANSHLPTNSQEPAMAQLPAKSEIAIKAQVLAESQVPANSPMIAKPQVHAKSQLSEKLQMPAKPKMLTKSQVPLKSQLLATLALPATSQILTKSQIPAKSLVPAKSPVPGKFHVPAKSTLLAKAQVPTAIQPDRSSTYLNTPTRHEESSTSEDATSKRSVQSGELAEFLQELTEENRALATKIKLHVALLRQILDLPLDRPLNLPQMDTLYPAYTANRHSNLLTRDARGLEQHAPRLGLEDKYLLQHFQARIHALQDVLRRRENEKKSAGFGAFVPLEEMPVHQVEHQWGDAPVDDAYLGIVHGKRCFGENCSRDAQRQGSAHARGIAAELLTEGRSNPRLQELLRRLRHEMRDGSDHSPAEVQLESLSQHKESTD